MVEAYSWHMSLNFRGDTGTAWEQEIAVFGVRGRFAQSMTSWPTHGALPYCDADVVGELEDDTTFSIIWEHYTKDTGPGTYGATQAVQKDAALAALGYWNAIRTNIGSKLVLREIRFQMNDRNGKSIGGSNKFILKTPSKGGAVNQMPPNVALCVSTTSNSPTRKGHGRWFLPYLSASLMSADGTVAAGARTVQVNAAKDFLEAILNTNQIVPAVVRLADDTFWDITGVRVGDELDVQNRRRNARPETYTSGALS